jgi:hypothetical protein
MGQTRDTTATVLASAGQQAKAYVESCSEPRDRPRRPDTLIGVIGGRVRVPGGGTTFGTPGAGRRIV